MAYTTLDIQRRLKTLGYNPGPIDGIPGRLTQSAIRAFQTAHKLDPDGIVGAKTLAALFPAVPVTDVPSELSFPWLDLAARKKGLQEGRDYTTLASFLRSDGKTLGDPRKLPWCGDFVETCIALTLPSEVLPGNPYFARNWAKFGRTVKPTLGAVLVFARGPSAGHVGFAVGQSTASFYVLGGNQSNSISIAPVAKSRLLAARWPSTVALPRIRLPQMVGGRLSTNEA